MTNTLTLSSSRILFVEKNRNRYRKVISNPFRQQPGVFAAVRQELVAVAAARVQRLRVVCGYM